MPEKLSKKMYKLSEPDEKNATVKLTGLKNFTGTVKVQVVK